MKERGMIFNAEMVRAILDGRKTQTRRMVKPQPDEDGLAKITGGPWVDTSERVYNFPFGKVGDHIWVRETFSTVPDHDEPAGCSAILYAADGNGPYGKWTPSIHMPRWASRITLEITGVRVERLNAISDIEAMREGIQNLTSCSHADFGIPGTVNAQHPVRAFQLLWESIYGADNWQANPWVWVIEFRVVTPGGD